MQEWWESRYQESHTPWDRERPSPALYHWLNAGRLRPGRVVIPGCGRGHEVIELARRGFTVTAIDIAPTPVAFLQRRLAEEKLPAKVVQADLFKWCPSQPVDAVYDQTSLCAFAPSYWEHYVEQLYGWLRPGGELFVLFMQTNREGGPPYHCGLGEMQRLFSTERWRWPAAADFEIPHPVGFVEQGYVLVREPEG
ncbi:MAG: methyltransferase domain-containing protein [Acidiferrobacterales bacterium]